MNISLSFLAFGNSGHNILSDFRKLGIENPLYLVGSDKKELGSQFKLSDPSELDVDTTYLITGGLGGETAIQEIPYWLTYMNDNHIEYRAIFCTPFRFEAKVKHENTVKAQEALSVFSDIKYHSLNEGYDQQKELLLSEALQWHAEIILKKFEDWEQVVISQH